MAEEEKKEEKKVEVTESQLKYNALFQIVSYIYSCINNENVGIVTSINMQVLEERGYSFSDVISVFTHFSDLLCKDNDVTVRSVEAEIGHLNRIDETGMYLLFTNICKKKYSKKEKAIPIAISHFTEKSYLDLFNFLNDGTNYKGVTIKNDYGRICCDKCSIVDLFVEVVKYDARIKKDILPEPIKIALELDEKD